MPVPSKRYLRGYDVNRQRLAPLKLAPSNRLRLVFLILCLGILGLVGRMAWLQVLQASELEARARSFQIHRTKPLGTRRSIVDRNGRLVALDEERFRVWAHPRYFNFPGDDRGLVRTPLEVSKKLSDLISIPMRELVETLSKKSSGIKLLEGVNSETANAILKLGISGLDLEPYPQRIYPQDNLFANVVGFLNQDRIPQAGLEQSLNKKLLRHELPRKVRRSADGTPLPNDVEPGVFVGDNLRLQLTLDARLQELALKELKKQVLKWDAKKGVAIVMDVTNGELLALASTPTYDPNQYWDYHPALFREWSVQDLFEPGSTFKPINLALALQENVIQRDGTVFDGGAISIGGWKIQNHDKRGHGKIDFAQVLEVSSNVGMVKAMNQLSPSLYWTWLKKLGIDTKPTTDLPGAVAGHLKTKEEFVSRPIEPATASYGQGFSLTPLKLIQLHALLANGGYLVNPHITRGLTIGDSLYPKSPQSRKQLLKLEVTQTVLFWMESVVNKGSGQAVKTPGYRIGGKTGTAQKAVGNGYKPGLKICSFVASLPIGDPRYAVLVVVDEPKGQNAYGSTVAAPVAKEIIDALLVLEKIPPSNDKQMLQPARG